MRKKKKKQQRQWEGSRGQLPPVRPTIRCSALLNDPPALGVSPTCAKGRVYCQKGKVQISTKSRGPPPSSGMEGGGARRPGTHVDHRPCAPTIASVPASPDDAWPSGSLGAPAVGRMRQTGPIRAPGSQGGGERRLTQKADREPHAPPPRIPAQPSLAWLLLQGLVGDLPPLGRHPWPQSPGATLPPVSSRGTASNLTGLTCSRQECVRPRGSLTPPDSGQPGFSIHCLLRDHRQVITSLISPLL